MKKPHIVIIDDGINEDEINNKIESFKVNEEDKTLKTDFISHGTYCCKIIEKYLKVDVQLSSIKLLDNIGKGNAENLIKALEIAESKKADIINLSLGSITFKDKDKILPIINSLANKGIVIVCAVHNKNYYTYPASFSNVISVCADRDNMLKSGEYECLDKNISHIFIKGFSKHKIEFKNGNFQELYPANSYAAPMITSIIANNYNTWSKEGILNIEFVKNKLKNISNNNLDTFNLYSHIDWIERGIFINIGETQDFDIKYLDRFNIVQRYDFKNENDTLNELENNDLKDIDTIIIKSEKELSKDLFTQLTDKIRYKIKSIVNLDKFNFKYNKYAQINNLKTWQNIDISEYYIYTKNKVSLEEISVPTITVIIDNKNKFFANEMAVYFRNNEYNAGVFSEDYLKCLSDVEYIHPCMDGKDKKSNIKFVNEIVTMRNLDMCILETYQDFNDNYKLFSDIFIDLSEGYINIHYETISKIFTDKQDAFSFIYALLTN